MIDTTQETLLSLTEIARRLPRRRGGKRTHPATLFRWCSQGIRGIRLEYILAGGIRCSTLEAVDRFFQALTARAEGVGSSTVTPSPKITKQRKESIAKAEKCLAAAGISHK